MRAFDATSFKKKKQGEGSFSRATLNTTITANTTTIDPHPPSKVVEVSPKKPFKNKEINIKERQLSITEPVSKRSRIEGLELEYNKEMVVGSKLCTPY